MRFLRISASGQSDTKNSDLILNPIYYTPNPMFNNSSNKYYVVLCEVEGTNEYTNLLETYKKTLDKEPWFGIEQEYFFHSESGCCADHSNIYYCNVGNSKSTHRTIINEHVSVCIDAGIKICGINSEVVPFQYEFQIGPLDPLEVCNQLWLARYFLISIAEKYDSKVIFHPKPYHKVNGSGAHTNYSTKKTREDNGIVEIYKMIDKLSKNMMSILRYMENIMNWDWLEQMKRQI